MNWTPVWAVIGALIGATGTFLGVVVTQRETLRREFELRHWEIRAEAYTDLVNWTAWVQHWFIVGAPDPAERPLTVTMARTAARITAFGDQETGEKAFQLLKRLRPEVAGQDIRGRPPPSTDVKDLADELARLATGRLSHEPGGRRPGARSSPR